MLANIKAMTPDLTANKQVLKYIHETVQIQTQIHEDETKVSVYVSKSPC